jgi:UDP-glucose-4-epimerase GalE
MGFIGSHTAKAFQQAGYYVIGIDRTWTIDAAASFVDELIIDDFVNITAKVAKINNVDAIIHIAGTSLVGPSIANPGEYYDNNVAKTNQMLDDLALAEWKGTIVFSSSAATYGNDCIVPIHESSQGVPVSPYGHSKKMCEYVIESHAHAYGHKGIALRYFNACGCDLDGDLGNNWDDTHLIPRVVQSVLERKTLTINGNDFSTPDGTCIRDYLHVSDIADAHVLAVDLAKTLDFNTFKAYNLGTGQGISNLEIVQAVESATGLDVDYELGPRRFGDPAELIADPNKFMSHTQWRPKYSQLETIVSTTVKWMENFNVKIIKAEYVKD